MWKSESIQLPKGVAQQFTYSKNGMKVLVCEMHRAPIAAYMRVVNAGSSMEDGVCGKGVAHFIEHMSFRIKDGEFWKFEREGHEDNAMTTEDSTSFYDFGNFKHIKDVITVDGRRFLTKEVPANGIPVEMHAVLNEEERGRQASGVLFRTAQASSHLYDRYHYPTIGMRHDITHTSAQDMQTFREKYYKLNNSTFVVVGHVNTQELLDHFEKTYGHIEMEEEVNHSMPEEPVQTGQRIINLNMPAPCSMLCLTWVSPPARARESVAMSVLQRIISNGDHGRKKELIDKGVIHNVGCYAPRNTNAYIWCLHGSFGHHDTATLEKGEAALHKMLHDIAHTLKENELLAAVKSIENEWTVAPFKTIHSTTMALGEAVALGNWKDISSRVETLKQITVEDIQHVIGEYLNKSKSTSVRLYPSKVEIEAPKIKALEAPKTVPVNVNKSLSPLQWSCESKVIRNGNAVLQCLETSDSDMYCTVSIPFEYKDRQVASIMADMVGQSCYYNGKMYKGTDLVQKVSELGLEVSGECSLNHMHLNFAFRKENKEAYDFMVQGILNNSVFSDQDISTKQRTSMAEIASLRTNQSYICKRELLTRLFNNTPYGEDIGEKLEMYRYVTPQKLQSFYNEFKSTEEWNCTMVYPKGKQPNLKALLATCKNAFESKRKTQPHQWVRNEPVGTMVQKVTPGVGTSMVLMGQTTQLKQYSKESIALSLATRALGGGMTARLMSILRGRDGDKNGVYGVYASLHEQQHAPAYVVINASFTPGLEHHGLHQMRELVNDWVKNGITETELENSKHEVLGQRSLEMDNFESVSSVYHRHLMNEKVPAKEWNSYIHQVSEMTLEDVNNALQHLNTEKWTIVSASPIQNDNFLDDTDDEN